MKLLRLALPLLLLLSAAVGAYPGHAAGPSVLTGTTGSAAYRIEVPAHWNGTLVLFSHGYVTSGSTNPAQDAPDPGSASWLLAHGYALAGSSYGATGWAVVDALHAQTALLALFDRVVGHPVRTIAWGQSLGGLITAALVEQNPNRFAGSLPMCGVLAGGVAVWNQALDAAFVFKTLLAPHSTLQLVQITDPLANVAAAQLLLAAAQSTLQGRARLALVAAVADEPGWFDPYSPAPAPAAYASQLDNQLLWDQQVSFPFLFAARADLEQRAGGNPSSNLKVNYATQLAHSSDLQEVRALYRAAGLSLNADLQLLQHTPRISAEPQALTYLHHAIDLTGTLQQPMLTMHTTGDGLVSVQNEQDFARVVHAAGTSVLLQQLFVQRAGHCTFTPAEEITAFQQLISRITTGHWNLKPTTLNRNATALARSLNTVVPAFVSYSPGVFLRPEDH